MSKSNIFYREINELLKQLDIEIQGLIINPNSQKLSILGIDLTENVFGINDNNIGSIIATLKKSKIITRDLYKKGNNIYFSRLDTNTLIINAIKYHYDFNLESYMKDNIEKGSTVNIGRDMVNSEVNQESDLRESEFHHIEKKYPNNAEATSQKESTIFQKIYNLTNHQVIGGTIAGIIVAIIIYFMSK